VTAEIKNLETEMGFPP